MVAVADLRTAEESTVVLGGRLRSECPSSSVMVLHVAQSEDTRLTTFYNQPAPLARKSRKKKERFFFSISESLTSLVLELGSGPLSFWQINK